MAPIMQQTLLKMKQIVNVRYSSNITQRSIFISQSKDVYMNLALQQWLYSKFDLTRQQILMLWQNDPCVVIGMNQNPWLEANVVDLPNVIDEKDVKLARSSTEGNAVFHDNGNLNLTFLTSNGSFNHKYNLEIIRKALFREHSIKIEINDKEDLNIRNYRVSESSAKFGETNSYDQCSLFVNTNKTNLAKTLSTQTVGIHTQAPVSQKSKMINVSDENRKATVNSVIKAIGWEYLRTLPNTATDGGIEHANRQKGFQMVNPTEKWFPGIAEIRDKLASPEWLYGNTPSFTVSRTFTIPDNLFSSDEELQVKMTVENGRIAEVTLYIPPDFSTTGFSGEANVVTPLKGQHFSHEALKSLESSMTGPANDKDKFVTECVKKVMTAF